SPGKYVAIFSSRALAWLNRITVKFVAFSHFCVGRRNMDLVMEKSGTLQINDSPTYPQNFCKLQFNAGFYGFRDFVDTLYIGVK
ncbi:hypothetical protein L9F63_002263, partial [Diploptera punctata]